MSNMAQRSVAAYFNTRKRVEIDELKINKTETLSIVGEVQEKLSAKATVQNEAPVSKVDTSEVEKVVPNKIVSKSERTRMKRGTPTNLSSSQGRRQSARIKGQQDIQTCVNAIPELSLAIPRNKENTVVVPNDQSEVKHGSTPQSSMKICNGMDTVLEKLKDASLSSVKKKLGRSSRLTELRALTPRFGELQNKLTEIEKVTSKFSANLPQSPKSHNCEATELDVHLSSHKLQSPEKPKLSPKKHSTVRKKLQSPTKNSVALCERPKKIDNETSKPALRLPYKYRSVAEMFRAIDTVSQLLYNRKETITWSKLKPAVENMTKRNLRINVLGQIKKIYPEAFKYTQEKLRVFGSGKREEKWELVLTPLIGGVEHINSETLLARRRVLFSILLDKVKDYHHEFLMSLEPPLLVPKNEINKWHPEFDIEIVPDIEEDNLPEPPVEMKMKSGQEVLEKARDMFGCNNRMEQALERLRAKKEEKATETVPDNTPPSSILKGIPKLLLEKVRQRQAAKALISMTKSVNKEKELEIHSRLPELARLTKNLFVSEKKSVLKLDDVVEKLGNCYRITLTKTEMEDHIKLLVKEFPEWLILHQSLSKIWFLKQLNKDADVNEIRHKLETMKI